MSDKAIDDLRKQVEALKKEPYSPYDEYNEWPVWLSIKEAEEILSLFPEKE